MKVRDEMKAGGNVSFCYCMKSSIVTATVLNGEIDALLVMDRAEKFAEFHANEYKDRKALWEELINCAARLVAGRKYKSYIGYTDEQIMNSEMEKCNCCECPFFNNCEYMEKDAE